MATGRRLAGSQAPAWEPGSAKLQLGVTRGHWKLELPRLRSQAGAWERAETRGICSRLSLDDPFVPEIMPLTIPACSPLKACGDELQTESKARLLTGPRLKACRGDDSRICLRPLQSRTSTTWQNYSSGSGGHSPPNCVAPCLDRCLDRLVVLGGHSPPYVAPCLDRWQ